MLLGVPVSWIGVFLGMLKTFGGTSGDISQAASQITGGVAVALWAAIIGQSVALVGLALLLIALFAFKVREPWVMKWGRYLMFPWLILFPVGTAAGVLMLVYFSRHKEEFTIKKEWPNQSTEPGSPSRASSF
jgi:hypothetical protein